MIPEGFAVEKRPCKECKFFKIVSSPPPICRKLLMAVVADMYVTYSITNGTCFEPALKNAKPKGGE